MKKLSIISMVILLTLSAFSQSPQKMSYQCVVRNTNGGLVTNQTVGIRISILQGTITGTVIYQETYNPNPQTNANGLVTLEIGNGTPVTGTFSAINWASGPYFLKTETDPAGGTNYTILGSSQLLSVPYALYAKTAGSSDDAVKISGNQTITGNKIFTGTTTVASPVNSTDAANKAYVDALKEIVYNELLAAGLNGIVKDIDGNIYKTIKIGDQVWMTENLKTTKYNDGQAVPLLADINAWLTDILVPGYCWYNNDEVTYKNTYGALYGFYTVTTDKICPTGWHVPDNDEWYALLLYLDPDANVNGSTIAGGKLKEAGTKHWLSPNTGATNETGFTALPGGFRLHDGTFVNIGTSGMWWSAGVSKQSMNYSTSAVDMQEGMEGFGVSIRCLKD